MTNPDQARFASRQGVFACVGLLAFSVVLFLLGRLKSPDWLWDAAFFVAIGIGIYRFSRIAAVAGLTLYLIERVLIFQQQGEKALTGLALYLLIIFTFAFVNGIRGTFAYKRLLRAQRESARGSPPSAPGSATKELR